MNDQKAIEAMLDRAGIVWTFVERAEDAAVVLEVEAKARAEEPWLWPFRVPPGV